MHKDDYPPVKGGREVLLAAFNVPSFVASRTCFELNGYAGCRPIFEEPQPQDQDPFGEAEQENTNLNPTLTSCTTWFRYLTKMVRKIDHFQDKHKPHDSEEEYVTSKKAVEKGYEWFEMSVFTRWDNSGKCRVLCIDTPPDFPDRLRDALLLKPKNTLPFFEQADPFALHADLLDIMLVYSDISVWRVRDPIRLLEKSRLNGHDLFEQIHDHARHAYHSSEVLEAAIQTVEQLGRYQTEVNESIGGPQGQGRKRHPSGLTLTYRAQAREYTQFQISVVRSLKLRSDSSLQRLKNEVGLVCIILWADGWNSPERATC